MKIAVVGKGGSGKSTFSWLLAKYLVSKGGQVLAVDADHNMDLSSNLGYEYNSQTPTIHHKHDIFRKLAGLDLADNWSKIVLSGKPLPKFSLNEIDNFSKSILINLEHNLDLAIVGLGDDDMLYSDKCSHGHTAPLKYYLSLLETNSDHHVVVDSVAGTDMVNYGLYVGCDIVICVVEGHKNSIKVANQLKDVCTRIGLPFGFIINKPNDLDLLKEFKVDNQALILGEVGYDQSVALYDFANVSGETLNQVDQIVSGIKSNIKTNRDVVTELYNFEARRMKLI